MVTTALAPTNIAVLKYWGKNPPWEEYLIPTKSSLSFTVEGLHTRTTTEAKAGSGKVDFTLNGTNIQEGMKEHEYVRDFLEKVGKFFPDIRRYDYRIVSENNFPTAAGFASSASGFAALIKSIAGELPEFAEIRNDEKKLSALARLGSGSATRSIPSRGGFVEWKRGVEYPWKGMRKREDIMFSSYAETLFSPSHWPDLRIIYAKVEEGEKKVKSRAGMKISVESNPLYMEWVNYEERVMKDRMAAALSKKDFPKLGELVMRASNNLHQICLGTYPPIVYLNETSLRIMEAVHGMNSPRMAAAYTFDAGPNAVILTESKNEREVLSALKEIVGPEGIHATRMGPGARLEDKHLF